MASLKPELASVGVDEAWQRLAQLSPRLAPHVKTSHHRYRGEEWLVLSDHMTGSHFRCSIEIEPFLLALDGNSSIEAAYASSDCKADRLEVLELLAELQSAQLLLDLAQRDGSELAEQKQQLQRQRLLKKLASPLAIQLPLLDPDRFLAALAERARPLLTPGLFWLWLALVAIAGAVALENMDTLFLHWDSRFLDPGNLLLLWLLYPLVKGLHELGHGITTRSWGGEVHEMGIMLLVFTPVPYVDASASTAFPDRRRRMAVAGAGIVVELLLSALALIIFLNTEAGWLRDICFNVMVIGGLSTLLFNGNPLLRFDGYYILTDILEMPNLRNRANACLGATLKRPLFGLSPARPEPTTGREKVWLLGYAVLSGLYRIFIGLSIALFVAGKYFFIGMALAIMLIVNQMILPLTSILRTLWSESADYGSRARFGTVVGSLSLLTVLLLFFLPVNNSTRAEGILILPDNTELRTRADGFVEAVHKLDGDAVQAGEIILVLANPELAARERVLSAQSRELTLRYNHALSGERVEIALIKRELDSNAAELQEAREQLAQLEVRSSADGTLALPRADDLPGRFLPKGDLIGHVLSPGTPSVQVVIGQGDVDRVSRRTREVEVRLVSRPSETIPGGELRDTPKATTMLSSALLGSRQGGSIPVDARDGEGLKTTRPVFQLEIELPERQSGTYLGQRAHVRFEHFRDPVGRVWYRQIRQKLLENIGI